MELGTVIVTLKNGMVVYVGNSRILYDKNANSHGHPRLIITADKSIKVSVFKNETEEKKGVNE